MHGGPAQWLLLRPRAGRDVFVATRMHVAAVVVVVGVTQEGTSSASSTYILPVDLSGPPFVLPITTTIDDALRSPPPRDRTRQETIDRTGQTDTDR
jgi:hypothetical protein